MKSTGRLGPVVLCSIALFHPAVAWTHSAHEHRAKAPADGTAGASGEVRVAPADLRIPPLPLVNQDGTTGMAGTDWIGDRIVVVDFIFTTCPLVCPLLSAVMADVQDRLGDAAGDEVRLISISVDPVTDVPRRLKEYAERYGAGPGWIFLTGEKPDVDKVLRSFGAYAPDFGDHPPMFLVGDAREGRWTRVFGIPAPERIVSMVREYRSARAAARSGRAK